MRRHISTAILLAAMCLPGAAIAADLEADLEADRKPVLGADGFFVPDQLIFYTAMARSAGWGKVIPDMLRNENWNCAVFTLAKQVRPDINQAECLACHKPLDKTSYTFTIEQITALAKARLGGVTHPRVGYARAAACRCCRR